MKTREEIERASGATYSGSEMTRGLGLILLEVLLDIRDLLTPEVKPK